MYSPDVSTLNSFPALPNSSFYFRKIKPCCNKISTKACQALDFIAPHATPRRFIATRIFPVAACLVSFFAISYLVGHYLGIMDELTEPKGAKDKKLEKDSIECKILETMGGVLVLGAVASVVAMTPLAAYFIKECLKCGYDEWQVEEQSLKSLEEGMEMNSTSHKIN